MFRRGLEAAPRWLDGLLNTVVLVTAAWTVGYHLCLVLDLGVRWALGLTVLALGCWVAAHIALAGPATDGAAADEEGEPASLRALLGSGPAAVTVVLAVVATLAMALGLPWPWVWIPWVLAAVAGTVTATLWLGQHVDPETRPDTEHPWTVAIVVAWALAMAVLSLWTLRDNPDDLFYINLSQWVAEHGAFPLRDTLFAELQYPISNWPPIASYDGGVGAVGWLFGLRAASVAYILVPPLASFLSVLAAWQLLRAWRVPYLAVALSITLVFLLADAGNLHAPGSLFVTRLWQGKVILLCVLVPWLLARLVRYAERPDRRGTLWLLTGGIASVGLTTTAMFLVPVVALAGAAPLLRAHRRQAAVAFGAAALYPLGAAIFTRAVGGYTADVFGSRHLFRFDPEVIGHSIFLTGLVAVMGVGAVLLGPLLVPHRDARLTTGLCSLAFAAVLIPGVTQLAFELIGLGPTLWRFSWVCTISLLVGVLGVRLAGLIPGRQAVNVGGVAVLVVALLAAFGQPITERVDWQEPFHWQREEGERVAANRLLARLPEGSRVLAGEHLATTIAVTTTDLKTVAPRAFYLDYLRGHPDFHYAERRTLVNYASGKGERPDATELQAALEAVPIEAACLKSSFKGRIRTLTAIGMTKMFETPDTGDKPGLTCLRWP